VETSILGKSTLVRGIETIRSESSKKDAAHSVGGQLESEERLQQVSHAESIRGKSTVAEVHLVGRLRAILTTRRGEPAAIRARDLVVLLGLGHHNRYPERSIREAIGILIREGLPIGSTVTEPAGYFVVSSEDQLRRCLANYSARARAIEDKGRALADAFRHGPAQPTLWRG
jgi:hypothetical protein